MLNREDVVEVALRLNDGAVKSDFISLIDHKDYWTVLDSVYDKIDALTQYEYMLNKISIDDNLNTNILMRIYLPFRFFLNNLLDNYVTQDEFNAAVKKTIQHDNVVEFLKFIESVWVKRKTQLYQLRDKRNLLDQAEFNIFKDMSITPCSTKMLTHDNTINVPFVLLRVYDQTFKCTPNDVKIIIDKLNNAIEGSEGIE